MWSQFGFTDIGPGQGQGSSSSSGGDGSSSSITNLKLNITPTTVNYINWDIATGGLTIVTSSLIVEVNGLAQRNGVDFTQTPMGFTWVSLILLDASDNIATHFMLE